MCITGSEGHRAGPKRSLGGHRRVALLGAAIANIAFSSVAWAQAGATPTGRLVGTVIDSASGVPVASAMARLSPSHALEPTHDDGTFAFSGVAPGEYTLTVEMLGYASRTRTVRIGAGETTRVSVALRVSALPLDALIVTGTLDARAGSDVISAVSVVSGAELDRRIDATVAATLRNEPGLAVSSLGPSTARPVIRGLGGDRIVFLEDGLKPGDLSSTSSDHAVAVEPITARRLEVVRGPMSLLYGSSALGGVVNVVRDEIPTSVPQHMHGTLVTQALSASRGFAAGGFGTAGRGPVALRLEASARTSGDLQTPDGSLENTGGTSFTLAGGASVVGDAGHFGAAYRFYDNDYGIPGGFVGGHEHGVDIAMQRKMLRTEGELHREAGPFSSVRFAGAFADYQHAELELSGDIGTAYAQDLWSAELVGRREPNGALGHGAVGVSGQYRDTRTAGSLRTPSTYDYSFAVFAVQELGTGRLRAQLGARYDRAHYVPRDTTAFIVAGGRRIPVRERTFGAISGSVGALFIIHEAVRAGFSLSRAYRTPDFNELYSNGPHLAANSFDVGDPSLSQETGLGADVFVRITHERLGAEVAAFWNQLDDYVFPSSRGRFELGTQGGRPRFQYTNEDARFVGAEGALTWNPADRLALETTVSWVAARFTSDRAPIPVLENGDTTFVEASPYPPLIPPLLGNLEARYERARFFAGAGVRWAAEQDRLGDFESTTAGYAIGSINAGVRVPHGGRLHTLTLRIDNVTDAAYRNHLSRIKDIMPEAGRDISLVYRLTF